MALFDIITPRQMEGAADVIRVRLQWEPDFARQWAARYERTQKLFDLEFIRVTEPYVPFDTGTLAGSAPLASHIGEGEIIYNTPYAADQYYNTARSRPYDPRRGAFWAERSKGDNLPHLEAFAQEAMRL